MRGKHKPMRLPALSLPRAFRMVPRMAGDHRIDFASNAADFFGGVRSAWLSVFAYVLFGMSAAASVLLTGYAAWQYLA